MSIACLSEQKKWETNSKPQSEVTCLKTPCLKKTWRMKSQANSGESTVLYVEMKILCLNMQSMITRIEEKSEGSCSTKSMQMEFHGFSGIGSCCRVP